jgi:cytidylate kinase
MIIAIDGTSSSGKSSVAEQLSKKLKFELLNTGFLYRWITLQCIEKDIDLDNKQSTVEIALACDLKNIEVNRFTR